VLCVRCGRGHRYLALTTSVLATAHIMAWLLHHVEMPAILDGYVTLQRPRALLPAAVVGVGEGGGGGGLLAALALGPLAQVLAPAMPLPVPPPLQVPVRQLPPQVEPTRTPVAAPAHAPTRPSPLAAQPPRTAEGAAGGPPAGSSMRLVARPPMPGWAHVHGPPVLRPRATGALAPMVPVQMAVHPAPGVRVVLWRPFVPTSQAAPRPPPAHPTPA
jgi:hypothetical protein